MATKEKSKTGLAICIVVVIIVVAVVVGIVIANKNKAGNSEGDGGTNGGETSQTTSLTAGDLQNIDKTIEFGDFDGMQTLSKSIQNGEKVGKVVKIDGVVSKPGTSYSIVQVNEANTKKIGTKFVIEGADDADYPKDGDRIVITGKVVEDSPMSFIIKTVSEKVETK